jgi:MinD-like ATPase involved in chromosome partitioning or flagellar assembly
VPSQPAAPVPRAGTERRIIPISSGKGGVGKTTLAINYALSLSRHGRTVLVDLDTGTSSVRAAIDVPVQRDLYHFFKRGHTLGDCVTTLSEALDPRGLYRDFGFIAAPKHLIEDVTNFTPARREKLIDALNALDARFIVLDLKAGLDTSVIDFLPYSNSGILVFTPQLGAATLAASDIVKAILFRKLRALFAPGSTVYAELPGISSGFVNSLIDRVEDVYDSGMHNLDAFVADLQHALGGHPVVGLVANAVETFLVHFVLNRFNGVKGSFDTAVRPFVSNLAENVSAGLTILNLGWVVDSDRIHESNVRRIPALLAREPRPRAAAPDPGLAAVDRLAALHLPGKVSGRGERPRAPETAPRRPEGHAGSAYLDTQLDMLRHMFEDLKGTGYRDNFSYITARTLHVMKSRRTSDFGDTRIFKASELREAIQARGR